MWNEWRGAPPRPAAPRFAPLRPAAPRFAPLRPAAPAQEPEEFERLERYYCFSRREGREGIDRPVPPPATCGTSAAPVTGDSQPVA